MRQLYGIKCQTKFALKHLRPSLPNKKIIKNNNNNNNYKLEKAFVICYYNHLTYSYTITNYHATVRQLK